MKRAISTSRCCEIRARIRTTSPRNEFTQRWFVPIVTGRITDLHCGIVGKDGKTHAVHGMVGEIVIE